MKKPFLYSAGVLLAGALLAGPALAAPGDIYEVTADLVNLRAGPSDEANVRDRIEGGTQVLELDRDGNWFGIRTLEGGLEGWIYGDLLDRVSSSGLMDEQAESGFADYSTDFDRLIGQIDDRFGFAMFDDIAVEENQVTVTPSSQWLRATSQDAQALAATAIYQMWKNYRNNAPVTVVLLDETGADYVVIADQGENGPGLTVNDLASGSESGG